MRLEDDIDFTTLNWVKQELDDTLRQARQALETYVEESSDQSQLRFCASFLHQVQGTLRMVELYGAAMVVEEMERLVQSLLDDQIRRRDDAYAVLMRGMVQMPDYLERLQGGHKDIPIVLLPLLNDLRACRGEKLLSESVLFAPDLGASLPAAASGASAPLSEAEMRQQATRLRTRYQSGLLAWIKNEHSEPAIAGLIETLDDLRAISFDPEVRRLWWIAAGLLDAAHQRAVDIGSAVKLLFGKVDREIKRIADGGEAAVSADPPRELTQNLLYYLAHGAAAGERVHAIRETYRLHDLLPTQAELEHAKGSLGGKNRALLDTVSAAIKEDLMRVKDTLDLYLRRGDAQPSELSGQAVILDRVADTLGMLGLGVPRRVVQEQRRALDDLSSGARVATEAALLDVAGALLYVEVSLDENIRTLGVATPEPSPDEPVAVGDPTALPKAEVKRILDALLRESIANVQRAKADIVAYIESGWQGERLQTLPTALEEIVGAMRMLDQGDTAELVRALGRFVEVELVGEGRVPTSAQVEHLADAFTSIEYFLEATGESRSGREQILDVTRESLAALGYWPPPTAQELEERDAVAKLRGQALLDADAPSTGDEAHARGDETTHSTASVDAAPSIEVDTGTALDWSDFEPADRATGSNSHALGSDLPAEPVAAWTADSSDGTEPPGLADEAVSEASSADAATTTAASEDDAASAEFGLEAPEWQAAASELAETFPVSMDQPEATESGTHAAAGQAAPDDGWPDVGDSVEFATEVLGQSAALGAQDATGQGGLSEDSGIIDIANLSSDGFDESLRDLDRALGAGIAQAAIDAAPAPAPVEPEFDWVEIEEEVEEPIDLSELPGEALPAGFDASAGEDIDEDIREVFVEEVTEEIANIGRMMPALRKNPDDVEALRNVRRSFHTLKGSGRLVGALALGEFSWRVENMLNRVLDHTIAMDDQVLALLDHSRMALDQLRTELRGMDHATALPRLVMQAADRLVAGEPGIVETTRRVTRRRSIQVPRPVPPAPVAAEPAQALHEVDARQQDAMELAELEAAGIAGAADAAPVDRGVPEVVEEAEFFEGERMPEIEPMLLEVLRSEAGGYLSALESWIDAARGSGNRLVPTTELLRAVHTLHGALGMVEVPVVAEVVGMLEGYLKRLVGAGHAPSADGLEAMADVSGVVGATLALLDRPGTPVPPAGDLNLRLGELRDALPETQAAIPAWAEHADAEDAAEAATRAAEAAQAVSAEAQATTTGVDAEPGLVEEDALAAAPVDPDDWREPDLELPVEEPPAAAGEAELEAEFDATASEPVVESAEAASLADFDAATPSWLDDLPPAESVTVGDFETYDTTSIEALADGEPGRDAEAAPPIESGDEPVAAELLGDVPAADWDVPHTSYVEPEVVEHPADELDTAALARFAAEIAGEEEPVAGEAPYAGADADSFGAPEHVEDGERGDAGEADAPDGMEPLPMAAAENVEPSESLAAEFEDATAWVPDHHFDERDERKEPERLAASAVGDETEIHETAAGETTAEAEEIGSEAPSWLEDSFVPAPVAEPVDSPEPSRAEADDVRPTVVTAAAPVSDWADEADPDRPLLLPDLDPDLLEIFVEEGREILDQTDPVLAQLRGDPDDAPAIAALQRHLHTIKGNARAVGLFGIGDVSHALETLIESPRGRDDSTIELVQRGFDRLHRMVSRVASGRDVAYPARLIAIIEARAAGLPMPEAPSALPQETPAEPVVEAAQPAPVDAATAHDRLALEEDIGAWREPLAAEAAEVAEVAEVAEEAASEPVEAAATPTAEAAFAGYDAAAEAAEAEAVFAAAASEEDESDFAAPVAAAEFDREAERAEAPAAFEAEAPEPTREPAAALPQNVVRLDDYRLPPQVIAPEDAAAQRQSQELIRVRADLLDALVNYAGEVSIYRSRLEQQLGAFRNNVGELEQTVERTREQLRKLDIETETQIIARFQRETEDDAGSFDPLELDRFSNLQQLSRALAESVSDLVSLHGTLDDLARQQETLLLQQSRVASELQQGLMRTRMVPFETQVPFLRRLVRQSADELGKRAQLFVDGAQGEMDRNLLERMKAPLEHMLRNALAHGIEAPGERSAQGKASEGNVRIEVAREASEVLIRVSDDGRGLDREAIRRKAIERGLMRADSQLTDRDLFGFITETGFSTADTVSKLAGRGVGMDVVANEIRELGGSLSIDSEHGQGSRFTIRLPFTLAVTQAIMVRMGEAIFAVPMSSVQGVARLPLHDFEQRLSGADTRLLAYGGEEYAVHDLALLLGAEPNRVVDSAGQLPLLLVRSGDQRAAIRVDSVVGSREIVVKSTGTQIASVPGMFGATIMGDGSVVMILDLAPLVRRYLALRAELAVADELAAMLPGLDTETAAAAALPAKAHVKRQPLIMVVDDSITMRKVTSRVLERQDMEVVTAKDGVDAVEKLQERVPDLAILDIEMPRMDGYELATYIRNDARLRHLPLMMITSRTGEKHRQRAFEIGVDRFLGKPYQEADLMRTVFELLGESPDA